MTVHTEFVSSISEVAPAWRRLSAGAGPFLDYRFLSALETTGCVGAETAWQPHHLVVRQDNDILALMPGYLKYDSMGEYIFDHGWADAYHRHGMSYYPKWISAIPFTPVTASKLIGEPDGLSVSELLKSASDALQADGISSAHLLFTRDEHKRVNDDAFLCRLSVQFQWYNYHYASFDGFLSALTSRKRKDIRKAYRQLADQQISVKRLTGSDIHQDDLDFFIHCYQRTYLKRSGHAGYLSGDFFQILYESMSDRMLLVRAENNNNPVACALFFFDQTGLYGRYWGATQDVDGLHFICCYLEGIQFAIEHALPLFNPGTQGEHKILRGFEPTYCYSLHRLFSAPFHQAVEQFLYQERPHMIDYFNRAQDVLPFNNAFSPQLKTRLTPEPDTNVSHHKRQK